VVPSVSGCGAGAPDTDPRRTVPGTGTRRFTISNGGALDAQTRTTSRAPRARKSFRMPAQSRSPPMYRSRKTSCGRKLLGCRGVRASSISSARQRLRSSDLQCNAASGDVMAQCSVAMRAYSASPNRKAFQAQNSHCVSLQCSNVGLVASASLSAQRRFPTFCSSENLAREATHLRAPDIPATITRP
jgi:hypothetical protein